MGEHVCLGYGGTIQGGISMQSESEPSSLLFHPGKGQKDVGDSEDIELVENGAGVGEVGELFFVRARLSVEPDSGCSITAPCQE